MRKILALVILVIFSLLTACSDVTDAVNAEQLVRKWWNDNSTFSRPEVVWVSISYGNIRGFQADGYLFIDPNTPDREDLKATIVHEWLHYLVKEDTLINDETGFGRPIMKMVVETITWDIVGSLDNPADNLHLFKEYTHFE